MTPESYIHQWNERMDRMERMLMKHNTDLYEGSGQGNPSITQRLFRVEDSLGALLANSKWTIRLLVAGLLTGAVDLIVRGLHL